MRFQAMLGAATMLAVCLSTLTPGSVAAESGGESVVTVSTGSLTSNSTASGFGDALNEMRARNGLGSLREDMHLTQAAQAYAEDMARHAYFSHTGRDGSTVTTRARGAGCRGRGYFAENIAWGQKTAQAAFSGWAASAGHRDNMLGRNYGVFGLGQSSGMWVLIFADGS